MFDAIIPIWKPADWTSFDVVKKIRSQIRPAKVGHAGTLDPFAKGVLMLCTGRFTKKVESFMEQQKEYMAEVQLGSETDTLDPTGKITKNAIVPELTKEKIEMVIQSFVGEVKQEPPMYSALKKNGQPLYKLARKGIDIPRKKRIVKIYGIHQLRFTKDTLTIKVICGRGTYIRSLAKDIAEKLGTVGHLKTLTRTRIGDYDEKSCITLNEFPKWISAQT